MIQSIIAALMLSLSANVFAESFRFDHKPSADQLKKSIEWNKIRSSVLESKAGNWPVVKPFNEIEKSGFVAISGENVFELGALREAIARNLPEGVTLVIYVDSESLVPALKRLYSPYLDESRLKFLVVPTEWGSNQIWGRDSLPFPVYIQSETGAADPAYGLVDSIYPQDFEPDIAFVQAFNQKTVKTGFVFRGGNLLFDEDLNCFAERANEILGISDPDSFFKTYFGCKTVTILRQEGGIGDIDERVKFLPGKIALTDNQNYADHLRAKGYDVRMFPTPGGYYRTYMNTLVVNETIFVPQMGTANDQAALDAYRAVGFNPVGVRTRQLADQGHGNIHCLTMNYPPGAFVASLLGSDFVKFRGQ